MGKPIEDVRLCPSCNRSHRNSCTNHWRQHHRRRLPYDVRCSNHLCSSNHLWKLLRRRRLWWICSSNLFGTYVVCSSNHLCSSNHIRSSYHILCSSNHLCSSHHLRSSDHVCSATNDLSTANDLSTTNDLSAAADVSSIH